MSSSIYCDLIFKPFKVGDVINAQGFTGSVSSIQIFNTVLKIMSRTFAYVRVSTNEQKTENQIQEIKSLNSSLLQVAD